MITTLHTGDCRDILPTLPDCSVDAIVTDPPYGLRFMGRAWDYDVPPVEVWAECLRVLKPGGHLLVFAGTRTQHRMCCRIEDAGFEIRDMIAWVYGSGFPKSHDVSKAIDKLDASEEQNRRRLRFTAWVRSTGITSRQIDEMTGTNMGGHYTTAASQPAIMTREHLEQCRQLLGSVPEWVEREVDIRSVESENFRRREVIAAGKAKGKSRGVYGDFAEDEYNYTTAATDAARQWQGWGTALKPALEPITVARKPLTGTVAENVLEYGTGAINVGGCRVRDGSETGRGKPEYQANHANAVNGVGMGGGAWENTQGRWPANLIHDGSEEATSLLGSAARFFYCAKASKAERGKDNNHPTVKPLALCRWLVRLVTPPGGCVLDPYAGSGSILLAAQEEGFRAIGIELLPEHVEIIRHRLAALPAMLPIGEVKP